MRYSYKKNENGKKRFRKIQVDNWIENNACPQQYLIATKKNILIFVLWFTKKGSPCKDNKKIHVNKLIKESGENSGHVMFQRETDKETNSIHL